MIREIIVTSPQGVRLAFTAEGEKGLQLDRQGPTATFLDIRDLNKPEGAIVGVVPTSWLLELNENVT
jgi:hypothetical protein